MIYDVHGSSWETEEEMKDGKNEETRKSEERNQKNGDLETLFDHEKKALVQDA